jgi:hypothetical protein
LFLAASILLIATPAVSAQSLADQLLKNLKDSAKQEIRRSLEEPGLVDQIDYSVVPSFVIETTDGRRFQLRTVSFAADKPLDLYLGNAESISFSAVGDREYVLNVSFRPVEAPDGGLVSAIITGALNKTIQSDKVARAQARISAVYGTALNGADWVLDLRSTGLRSLQVIHEQ